MAMLCCAVSLATARLALSAGAPAWGPHPAVVRVMAPERDGSSFGSGALVAVTETHGLVVTNWHVVRDAAGPITVFFPDGFRSGATVLRMDRDWDLAALAIWRPKVQPFAISNEAPRPGEVLTIAGYGSGDYRAVAGRCTQYVSPGGNHPFEMVELDAPARNGDSGGPILNGRGELAGVLFGSAFGRTTGSYCGRLRWFLNSVGDDFQRMPSQQMIAQQPPRAETPLAAIPASNSNLPQAGEGLGVRATGSTVTQVTTRSADTSLPARVPSALVAVAAPPPGPLPAAEQIKTILAMIGVLAVLYHALRMLGSAVG